MCEKWQNGTAGDPEETTIPDMAKMWKKLYFQSEEAWGNAVNEFLTTTTFNQMVHAFRDQYLAGCKISNQSYDKALDMSVIPSKKDLAGLAELVIALEDKIDQIDYQVYGNISKIADSLVKMEEYQARLNEEIASLKMGIDTVKAAMQANVSVASKPYSAEESNQSKKKTRPNTRVANNTRGGIE